MCVRVCSCVCVYGQYIIKKSTDVTLENYFGQMTTSEKEIDDIRSIHPISKTEVNQNICFNLLTL